MTLIMDSHPDQAQRDEAIRARGVNVLVDAGAGTGKTSLLVNRLIEMVAPTADIAPVPIGRIAAITFTRKAAGELRLRIREGLLKALSKRPDAARGRLLTEALTAIDTAWIGTIHSFADRLLRLKPREAELSPSYEIVEDEEPLIHETFHRVLQSALAGTLAEELPGFDAGVIAETAAALKAAVRGGILAESREMEFATKAGLDALMAGLIRYRDVDVRLPEPAPFDAEEFSRVARAIMHEVEGLTPSTEGERWLLGLAETLAKHVEKPDPTGALASLSRQLQAKPKPASRKHTFANNDAPWKVWKRVADSDGCLLDALRAPISRWLATRLVRIRPVVLAVYERVKDRHRQVDQTDLLLKLRNLLARDTAVRAELQGLFDHVFVDEFQDTDPLQAELVLYLCEDGAQARQWDEVRLAPGRLTLVGDPKQSIYRFRRADIRMYDDVCRLVEQSPHLRVSLSTNFRSHPALIEWFNDRFERVLGTDPDRKFNRETGEAYHQPLVAGRKWSDDPCVHVHRFGGAGKAGESRAAEGRALACMLRWLVEASGFKVVDQESLKRRPVRYEDVAVLAISTSELSHLFDALDEADVPYASRGGRLFLQDPLNRQFLLGLRALADSDDGAAMAALLRPPFFAVDPGMLLRERVAPDDPLAAVREARALIHDLRRTRLSRPPGATARDLLERTAFARVAALGPNGAQRVARLREICLVLEEEAAQDGLDYDTVTARIREWIDDPIALDPPYPIGSDAVKILTVHQAKGLEFPVVVHWDALAKWLPRASVAAWEVSRDGKAWSLALDGVVWEEPQGANLAAVEQSFLAAERRRLVYVSATRARDYLILPDGGNPKDGQICRDLLHEAQGVTELAHQETPAKDRPARADAAVLSQAVQDRWLAGMAQASRPRYSPAGIAGVSHEEDVLAAPPRREGRFGPTFGTTVHAAIGRVLELGEGVQTAVSKTCRITGLDRHLVEAEQDVENAIRALQGLLDHPRQLEYPIAGVEQGRLLGGYVDLLIASPDTLDVIDFKTDPPPKALETDYPAYIQQVRAYGRLLESALGRPTRCALLFTGDGSMHWV